jgi:hypothetical protein
MIVRICIGDLIQASAMMKSQYDGIKEIRLTYPTHDIVHNGRTINRLYNPERYLEKYPESTIHEYTEEEYKEFHSNITFEPGYYDTTGIIVDRIPKHLTKIKQIIESIKNNAKSIDIGKFRKHIGIKHIDKKSKDIHGTFIIGDLLDYNRHILDHIRKEISSYTDELDALFPSYPDRHNSMKYKIYLYYFRQLQKSCYTELEVFQYLTDNKKPCHIYSDFKYYENTLEIKNIMYGKEHGPSYKALIKYKSINIFGFIKKRNDPNIYHADAILLALNNKNKWHMFPASYSMRMVNDNYLIEELQDNANKK